MSHSQNSPDAKHTIFVVDDEPMLLELAEAILRPMGCNVHTFRDPELALKEFPKILPDLVLTDYAMGRMSGMDLIRECRRIQAKQKIILLSGTVDEQVFSDAPVKPNVFMSKPYQIHEFSDTISKLLAA